MSVSEGHPPAPHRPIPIHLPRPPELDGLRFRLPLSLEKPAKTIPPLWNPALDLYTPSRNNDSKKATDLSVIASLSIQRCLPPPPLLSAMPISTSFVTSSAAASLMPASSALKSFKRLESSATPVKAPSSTYTAIYEHLERHFPGSHESQLTVLASKAGLFPILLGVPGSMISYSNHPTTVTHCHQPINQGHISLQNAINLAHSRSVMERVVSSQPQISTGALRIQHESHPQTHPNQNNQQQHNRNQQHPTTTQPSIPQSDRPPVLQNAMNLTLSHGFLGNVNTSPMMSPVLTLDNTTAHSYGRKLFPCPQCRYTTDRRNNLKRHMLTMHQTSSKMLECCGILFNTKASLREHAMIFHYHGYTCYFCGRRFCRKALLKRHLSVHNGQKDFVCHVCDYATSHKSNLERHRKVHSRQDDGKEGEEVQRYHDDDTHHYHDDGKSNASEVMSHDDVSSDELSVCSDYDDDIDEEINVHSD